MLSKPVTTVEDNAFMADLLGEVDVNIQPQAPLRTLKSAARRKTRVMSPPISREQKKGDFKPSKPVPDATSISTPPLEAGYGDTDQFIGVTDDAFPPIDDMPSSPAATPCRR